MLRAAAQILGRFAGREWRRRFLRVISGSAAVLPNLTSAGLAASLVLLHHYATDLPGHGWLDDYRLPEKTHLHAANAEVIAKYGTERRIVVPLDAFPAHVVDAFLATEDKRFFSHPGIDPVSIVRAAIWNARHGGNGRRPQGASTITQQVVRAFLLDSELTFSRKVTEAILAIRLERQLGKRRILELYLNGIYLGRGAYGVAAAAHAYFQLPLGELSLAQAAFLAGLPKAPAYYGAPDAQAAGLARRNRVIRRMLEDGRITEAEAAAAEAQPLGIAFAPDDPGPWATVHFAEAVRRDLVERYGERVYEGGLTVRTTMDTGLQESATKALRAGLIAYDRRHGWRGPLAHIDRVEPDWRRSALARIPVPASMPADWAMAVVLSVGAEKVDIGLADGRRGVLPWAQLEWARPRNEDQRVGAAPGSPAEVLDRGDVVMVQPVSEGGVYGLRQIPEVEGAIVAMDPHTGRVLAMSGGWSFAESEFNRAVQAWRQPGSAFKPFVVLAALDRGYTPSTLIDDAPIALPLGHGRGMWRPANYGHRYAGPRTLRYALERSRNVMIVRLANRIGIDVVAEYAERFAIVDHMRREVAMAIGAGETTLLRLTNAYAMLANGGFRVSPVLVDRVLDRDGRTLYSAERGRCPGRPDACDRIADPASVYQVVSMLQGVVERGTGRRVQSLGRPVAGKTGTTNESRDAWFVGFTPEMVVGVYVGFDEPRTLGDHETGASVAAPIFIDFMAAALEDAPVRIFRVPEGVELVRVRLSDGRQARAGDTAVIWEAFKAGSSPAGRIATGTPPKGDLGQPDFVASEIGTGTGALY